ncbi:hypothetical protein ACLRDC_20400 [Gluconacetobacter sacchari]|uniref:Core-binding (CB) domain-containing protein n=3 Tax=Gluconacetobacter sacchari TaxID=92759 RepID=A0A7W4NQT3_9PROT|nr:hypothetical protein [Gluconacetobacter sacchari]MBB2162702.1 hypothetical protein [Gluconacetobacter sacchari]GBQ28844.1 transposase [Gluconacetobacter sacchari DSM 12717]
MTAQGLASMNAATRATYTTSWSAFVAWCAARDLAPLPVDPAAAAAWLQARARGGRSQASLRVDCAALAGQQRAAGFLWARDERIVRAIARGRVKARPPDPAAALRRAAAGYDHSLRGSRDRALLLLAAERFTGAALAALDVEHLEPLAGGDLRVTTSAPFTTMPAVRELARRPGESACAVEAVELWRRRGQRRFGALFTSISRADRLGDRLSADMVRRLLRRAKAGAG